MAASSLYDNVTHLPGRYFFERADERGVWFKLDVEEEQFGAYFPIGFGGVLIVMMIVMLTSGEAITGVTGAILGVMGLVAALTIGLGLRKLKAPKPAAWVNVAASGEGVRMLDGTESVQRRIGVSEIKAIVRARGTGSRQQGQTTSAYGIRLVAGANEWLHLGDYGSEAQRDEIVDKVLAAAPYLSAMLA